MKIDFFVANYWEALFVDGVLVMLKEHIGAVEVLPIIHRLDEKIDSCETYLIESQCISVPERDEAEELCRKHAGDTLNARVLDKINVNLRAYGITMTQEQMDEVSRDLDMAIPESVQRMIDKQESGATS